MPVLRMLACCLLSLGLTVALVPLVRRWARRGHRLAQPARDRWHRRPVPTLGGVAMAAVLLPVAFLWADAAVFRLLLFSALMFAVGLVDDLRPIGPAAKLAGQMLVTGLFLAVAPPIAMTGLPALDTAVSFVWLVGITNAFNLLDNIDGLAAGVAAIAGTFAIVALGTGAGGVAGSLAVGLASLVGVAAGFLFYNWQPATIFMGDSGSHLLGSFIAGATLLSAPAGAAQLVPVCATAMLLLVPIADTTLVALTRPLAGRSPFLGGRDHLSHRLVAIGLSERRAVVLLCGCTIAGGLVALSLHYLPPTVGWMMVALYVAAMGVGSAWLGRVRIDPDRAPAPRIPDTPPRARPAAPRPVASRARAAHPTPIP